MWQEIKIYGEMNVNIWGYIWGLMEQLENDWSCPFNYDFVESYSCTRMARFW